MNYFSLLNYVYIFSASHRTNVELMSWLSTGSCSTPVTWVLNPITLTASWTSPRILEEWTSPPRLGSRCRSWEEFPVGYMELLPLSWVRMRSREGSTRPWNPTMTIWTTPTMAPRRSSDPAVHLHQSSRSENRQLSETTTTTTSSRNWFG